MEDITNKVFMEEYMRQLDGELELYNSIGRGSIDTETYKRLFDP